MAQQMTPEVYRFLAWLSVARPMAYAMMLPDYGKNSEKSDVEILDKARFAVYAYPGDNMNDQWRIMNNMVNARPGGVLVGDRYPQYVFVTDSNGVKRVEKLVYNTPDGLPPLVDMAPIIAETEAFRKVRYAANDQAAVEAQNELDRKQYAIQQEVAVKAAQQAAAAQSAAATAAAIAADQKKQADFAAAEAVRQSDYIERTRLENIARQAAEDARVALEKQRLAMIEDAARQAAELDRKAKEELERVKAAQATAAQQIAAGQAAAAAADEKRRLDFLAAEAQREIESQARIRQVKLEEEAAIARVEAKRVADLAAIEALNAKNAAAAAAQRAEFERQVAIGATQNANQVMLNNNITPSEVSAGNPLLLLLGSALVSYLIF